MDGIKLGNKNNSTKLAGSLSTSEIDEATVPKIAKRVSATNLNGGVKTLNCFQKIIKRCNKVKFYKSKDFNSNLSASQNCVSSSNNQGNSI